MHKKTNLFSSILNVFVILLCVFSLAATGKTDILSSSKKPYDDIVVDVAQRLRVPIELVHSIIKAESNYDAWAISSKGAMGLMQLMPITAKQYKVMNVFDPRQNIEGGVKYLVDLIKLYDGDTQRVLAAYNAGQEAIKRYGGIPPYRETRNYIKKVMASYPKSRISTRTKIYAFYDENGKYVLTDNKALWEKNKKRSTK
ncbi:MAG: lytic transglycosylase domain-containing protein [Candidatus Aminicenantes bacterium]|nr:MAG: lytic transglycosylase domain-containing protein [Candidatus Aminicenantes bacterium]